MSSIKLPSFLTLHWRSLALLALGVLFLAFLIGASDSVQACLSGQPEGNTGKAAQKGFAVFGIMIISPRCFWFFLREDSGAIIAVGTLVLAAYTYRLWGITTKLVKDGRQNAQRQLRAYVGLRSGDFREQITTPQHAINFKLTPVIKNSGQTPAYGVCCAVRVCISDFLNADSDYSLGKNTEHEIGALGPREKWPLHVWAEKHYPPEEIAELSPPGGKYLYIYGAIKYRDAFGANRTTEFCYWINRGTAPIWTLHPWHNNAD